MGAFGYHVVLTSTKTRRPASLIAAWIETDQPLQAILWSRPDRAWIYAPAIATDTMYSYETEDQVNPVDRQTAEQIAVTALGTELPDEETLFRMCQEGRATSLIWGRRRS